MTRPIGLTLGPVLFNWPADRLLAFYRGIAEGGAFDRVVVGEVVCGKRMPFTDPVWPEVIDLLEARGVEVVVATLALPGTPRERRTVADLAGSDRLVEVNDLTAVALRDGPFTVGPFVNVYNEGTARFLSERGARTLTPPVEIALSAVATIAAACPTLELEVFAFGRLPLALSSRCYHARVHGLHKDGCQFVCDQDPDGLDVATLDGQPFLAANGIQTLSHGVSAFLPTAAEARALGVARLRLSPQTVDMTTVAGIYRSVLDGTATPAEGLDRLAALALPGSLVGGYLRGEAGCRPVA